MTRTGSAADDERTSRNRQGGGAPRSRWRVATSSMAWWIVGTAVYHVGSRSRIQSSTAVASKPGVQITPAPAWTDASSAATSPWMWNSGIRFRHRSPGASCSVFATLLADVRRLAWESGTSFGRLVVPDVCSRSARSSPSGSRSHAAAGRDDPDQPSSNAPAAPGRGSTSTTATPRRVATDAASGWVVGSTSSAAGSRSERSRSSSGAGADGFSGAHAAARADPRKATAISGPFGSRTATRSARRSPWVARCSATAATRSSSCACVKAVRPGARRAAPDCRVISARTSPVPPSPPLPTRFILARHRRPRRGDGHAAGRSACPPPVAWCG